jgi:hypothetical protein
MVLTYFLNDFEMVPVAPIITGITLLLLLLLLLLLGRNLFLVCGNVPYQDFLKFPKPHTLYNRRFYQNTLFLISLYVSNVARLFWTLLCITVLPCNFRTSSLSTATEG